MSKNVFIGVLIVLSFLAGCGKSLDYKSGEQTEKNIDDVCQL